MILIRLHRLVNSFLHFRPDAHLQELAWIRTVHPVGEENKDQVSLGINPKTGAGKTSMPKRLRRSRSTGIRLCTRGIVLFRFIKTKSATADLAVILIEVIHC